MRCHDSASGELLWTLPNANPGGVTRVATAHGLHFFVTGGVNGGGWAVHQKGWLMT